MDKKLWAIRRRDKRCPRPGGDPAFDAWRMAAERICLGWHDVVASWIIALVVVIGLAAAGQTAPQRGPESAVALTTHGPETADCAAS